jgi:hypothetical protein
VAKRALGGEPIARKLEARVGGRSHVERVSATELSANGEINWENRAKKKLIAKSPFGIPWIKSEAMAPVVVFLASDDGCMVSGARYGLASGDSANYTA